MPRSNPADRGVTGPKHARRLFPGLSTQTKAALFKHWVSGQACSARRNLWFFDTLCGQQSLLPAGFASLSVPNGSRMLL